MSVANLVVAVLAFIAAAAAVGVGIYYGRYSKRQAELAVAEDDRQAVIWEIDRPHPLRATLVLRNMGRQTAENVEIRTGHKGHTDLSAFPCTLGPGESESFSLSTGKYGEHEQPHEVSVTWTRDGRGYSGPVPLPPKPPPR